MRRWKTWWLGWPAVSTYAILVNAYVGITLLAIGAFLTARSQ